MRATVIVLSWNGAGYLPSCLQAVLNQQGAQADLLVVDNGSTDGSADLVQERFPGVRVVENGRNLGFAAGMNVGMRLLRDAPDMIVLLNQDTVVAPDWLLNILAPFERDLRVGAVGCKIYYPDGRTLQHAGGWIEAGRALGRHFGHNERDDGQYDEPRDVEWVTGAALALRVSALGEVGLFDEGYGPGYFEDVDLCWRLRRVGYRVYYAPSAMLCHAESRSTRDSVRLQALVNRNRLRFVVKTFPAGRISGEFMIAERARLALLTNGVEARFLLRAYMEGILHCHEWITAREHYYPVSHAQASQLGRMCADLRRDLVAFVRQRGLS